MPAGFGRRALTAAPIVVRWTAGDAPRVRAALGAVLGIDVPAGRSIAMSGLRLEIAVADPGADPGHGSPVVDRLEVIDGDPRSDTAPKAGEATTVDAQFLALGWATVDVDRAAAAWAGVEWSAAPRDSIVGARALLGSPGESASDESGAAARFTVTTVLLEPDTEGRLAAALARHGEGPAVLYVGLTAGAMAGARLRLGRLGIPLRIGPGPLGSCLAIAGAPAWSPTLVIVPVGDPD